MKTSRQRLLEYIQAHRAVTAEDLSRALNMTPANARHHLAVLEQQGLVRAAGQRPAEGKGRPARLYSLSENRLGHNLDRLASALLAEFFNALPVDEQNGALERISTRLWQGISLPGVEPAGDRKPAPSLTQRLYTAVQHLNELNYQARWEAHAEAPRLILGHCPYASILSQHPELCRLDAALLERLAGAPVRQTAKQLPDPSGLPCCIFLIEKRNR